MKKTAVKIGVALLLLAGVGFLFIRLYFLWFDVPGFDRFRQAVASRAGPGFDPKGLSPALMMAAEPNFTGWMPIVVNQDRDCIAPVILD